MAASGKEDSKSKICRNAEGCEESIAISPRDNGNKKIYKSIKGPEGLTAASGEDCIDTKIYIQRVTAATSNATGLSGQCLSQESRKRKHQELHSNEKDSLIQSFSDFQKVLNSLQHSSIVFTFCGWGNTKLVFTNSYYKIPSLETAGAKSFQFR